MQLTSLYSSFQDTEVPAEERNKRIEAEFAKYLAFALPLPPMRVEHSSKFYLEQCSRMVNNAVSAFNEQYTIVPSAVADLTMELWKQRYCMLHSPHRISALLLLNNLLSSDDARLYGIAPRYTNLVANSVPVEVGVTLKQFVEAQVPSSVDNPSVI